MLKIKIYTITEVAHLYYQERAPERNYTPDAARKQLFQDRNIDYKLIGEILDKFYKEQKTILRKLWKS